MLSKLRQWVGSMPGLGPRLRRIYRRAFNVNTHLPTDVQALGPEPLYHAWIHRRVEQRKNEYAVAFPKTKGASSSGEIRRAPIFDILTLTYQTDGAVLRKTAASVFAQDYPYWHWVIWDNGSNNPQTLDVLDELAKHPNVTVKRHSRNAGITEGHRRALEFCRSEYVALLDHDDLLYPDALRVQAWHIQRFERPDLLYSDEDVCDNDEHRFFPNAKPDISPAMLYATPYPCHFMVVKRAKLVTSGSFTEKSVEGTQDWDMALRVLENGGRGVHVPEILYSWRSIPQSTAQLGVAAKPYVIEAQRQCLTHALTRRGVIDKFEVEPNKLFPQPEGHWRTRRKQEASGPTVEILIAGEFESEVRDWTRYPGYEIKTDPVLAHADGAARWTAALRASKAEFIAYIPPQTKMLSDGWLWEAVGLFELHPKTVMVGGCHVDEKGLLAGGGAILGLDGGVNAAHSGKDPLDIKYAGVTLCQRNVVALWNTPWILRREFALKLDGFHTRFNPALALADFGARAYRAGYGTIFTPFIRSQGPRAVLCDAEAIKNFRNAHPDLLLDDPFYSPFYGLTTETCYRTATSEERGEGAGYALARYAAKSVRPMLGI